MIQYFNISQVYRLMGGDGVLIDDKTGGDAGTLLFSGDINLRGLQGESHAKRKAAINRAIKEYDPSKHEVLSKSARPDKIVFTPTGKKNPVTGQIELQQGVEPVARIPLALQKYIIGQKASFARGNGVKLRPSDPSSEVFSWVYSNWYNNKTDYDLRETILRMMSETQCAVVYYTDAESLRRAKETKDPTKIRLKHKIWSPLKGSILYPYFDPETEALVALLREYESPEGDTRFDMYIEADPENGRPQPILRKFRMDDLTKYEQIELPYPKMPIVYWGQEEGECEGTKELIVEMERSFSDFSTQMGYSADPILFGKGDAINLPAKGSAGKFIEGSPDSDLKYVTPDNATESRNLHFSMLQKWIFTLNRAVLLDIETMRGLSDVSGAALDRYLADAYMEATDHQTGYWGKGVQRMVNINLSVAKYLLGKPEDDTVVVAEFTKYRINDIREITETMLLANGNRPLIDHEQSIAAAGLVDDPAESYKRILEEEGISFDPGQSTAAQIAQQRAQVIPTGGPSADSGIL